MNHKILIVDDEEANLRALERLFRNDYSVLTVRSGEEALAILANHDIALLISDQRMPGMTGIELLERTVQLRPQMARILLTGYTDVNTLIEAVNCGHIYRYVTKPWKNEDLCLTVSRALEHFQANKTRHNLEMTNRRLRALLGEINELATQAEDLPNPPETSSTGIPHPQLELIGSN